MSRRAPFSYYTDMRCDEIVNGTRSTQNEIVLGIGMPKIVGAESPLSLHNHLKFWLQTITRHTLTVLTGLSPSNQFGHLFKTRAKGAE